MHHLDARHCVRILLLISALSVGSIASNPAWCATDAGKQSETGVPAKPAWDAPFVRSQALLEAMDSKTCPILEILDIPLQRCSANIDACLERPSLGTAWRSLSAPGHGHPDALNTLYMSTSGNSLALQAPGRDPWQLHGTGTSSFDAVARSSDGAWQLRARATSKALLFAYRDDAADESANGAWKPVDRRAYQDALASVRLQSVTLTTLTSPLGAGMSRDVTFAVICSP